MRGPADEISRVGPLTPYRSLLTTRFGAMTEPLHTIGGEPLTPGVDLAGLAMRSLALGAATGSTLQTLVLWGARRLTGPSTAAPGAPVNEGLFWFVILGTMASMTVGGGTTWSLLAPVGSPWRRAGLAAVATFTTLIAAAAAVPVDYLVGPDALLGLAAVLALLALWAGRLVQRWPLEQHPA